MNGLISRTLFVSDLDGTLLRHDERTSDYTNSVINRLTAVRQLKALLHCERVIAFGDGKNDIDMFQDADEAYAVRNADEELKRYADAVIPSSDEDGVAQWLLQYFSRTAETV